MFNLTKKTFLIGAIILTVSSCFSQDYNDVQAEAIRMKMPSSVVVCRSKQCAPAKVSMSSEYIYNSLTQMLTNNNRQKALLCEGNPGNHSCVENFITVPIKVGMTPAYMYVDSVRITDVTIAKGTPQISLILNYNMTYNGQIPECKSADTLLYVKNADNIVMEDGGYNCKMTSIGTTSIKTLFMIDYIDLDYGYIGGYYSIGLSGPANGGGTGYMLIRLANDAYPLTPALKGAKKNDKTKKTGSNVGSILDTTDSLDNEGGVQIFPIKR